MLQQLAGAVQTVRIKSSKFCTWTGPTGGWGGSEVPARSRSRSVAGSVAVPTTLLLWWRLSSRGLHRHLMEREEGVIGQVMIGGSCSFRSAEHRVSETRARAAAGPPPPSRRSVPMPRHTATGGRRREVRKSRGTSF